MSSPQFYLVADDTAFAIDDDGKFFCAPVCDFDNTVDGIAKGEVCWEDSWELDDIRPEYQDYVEYVAHMCYYLKQAQQLTLEQNSEVFVK